MSPIEEHLVSDMRRRLAREGVSEASVTVLSAEADDWRYRIAVGQRIFEAGFDHRAQLWARETTSGAEKHLTSNDHARVPNGGRALELAATLIAAAVANPGFPPRDPPVI